MGNEDSKIRNRFKDKNSLKKKAKSSEHSQEQQVEEAEKKGFQSLDEKHRNILNIAITSALKRMQSPQYAKAEQEQKKLISSLNRYYQQNKNIITQVDARDMTQTDYETIIRTLRKHHFFKELLEMLNIEKDFITKFLYSIKKKTFKFKEYIYKQFDPPTNFYIVAEGKLFVQLNSMGLKPLSKTDHFGLQSIIYDSQQGESIKVRSSTAILYEISKQEIVKVHQKISLNSKAQIQQLLQQKVIFFNFLDHKQKEHVLNRTVKSTYSKGEIIFEKDYESNAFYVIKKGNVLIKIPQKKDLILDAGSSFGQSSFNVNKVQRQGRAVAYENNTIIYGIGSRTILKLLGNKLDCAVLQNSQKWALHRDASISELFFSYHFNMQKLLSRFKIKKCDKYQVLGKKGEPATKIFLNVRCEINFIKEMTFFNSKCLKKLIKKYEQNKKKELQQIESEDNSAKDQDHQNSEQQKQGHLMHLTYRQDIIVTERGSYSEADLNQVVDLIIEAVEQPQKHMSQRFRVDLSIGNIEKYAKLSCKNGITTILGVEKNFNMEMIVKVYHKNNFNDAVFSENLLITLNSKSCKGSSFIDENSVLKKVVKEKKIIQSLHYLNCCGFYKIEENEHNYYLILKYIKGVTLTEIHEELGIIPQILVKFYTLQLAFMLDYLHEKEIIYRNLRSDKILVDNSGFPNLFDFQSSKKVNQIDNYRTSTLIETPHYCSPQSIDNKSYSFQIDFWQLGIILYQMIYKQLPFGDNSQNPMEIYDEILKKQPNLKKINSNSALTGLLEKNPQLRISNFQSIIKQPYFQNFDWEMIQNRKMIPPYVPRNPTKRFRKAQVFIKKYTQ